MGTLYCSHGIKFFFYMTDCFEKHHVHVLSAGKFGKIWLDNGEWFDEKQRNEFKTPTARKIDRLVKKHKDEWKEEIDKRCGHIAGAAPTRETTNF